MLSLSLDDDIALTQSSENGANMSSPCFYAEQEVLNLRAVTFLI